MRGVLHRLTPEEADTVQTGEAGFTGKVGPIVTLPGSAGLWGGIGTSPKVTRAGSSDGLALSDFGFRPTSVSRPSATAKWTCIVVLALGGIVGVYADASSENANLLTSAEAGAGFAAVFGVVCFGLLYKTGHWT